MADPGITRRLKHWGWGFEDQQPAHHEVEASAKAIRERLGLGPAAVDRPVPLDAVELREPRLTPPDALAEICELDRHARASHALGKSYRDVVRGFRGDFPNPPDVVARPRTEEQLSALLDWCAAARAAAIPFGGGTSVVGGVEPDLGERPAVTLDMRELNRVLEVDDVSGAARIQAGASGPELANQLREHGFTLRHFPQSFEFSTLGGWIATRAGGHFATLWTQIDDLVESVRAITPAGTWESRRAPASGAGPSPDRIMLGSEGVLGVITEAWVRVQRRPGYRAWASVEFDSFGAGAEAVRALSQSGLHPSNCRLLDAGEAALTGASAGGHAVLMLGFESADHPLDAWLSRALECCVDHGGTAAGGPALRGPDARARPATGDGWREAFLKAPYLRDTLVAAGVVSETFETAVTWDQLEGLVEAVNAATRAALDDGRVTCRLTHVYPDGAAPYFTVLAQAHRGSELEQWAEIKAAASEAILAAGGTITHHHGVGRDHRQWYDRQRPDPFAAALRAAKRELDPAGILNPGVLIDP